MARPREFNENVVLAQSRKLFASQGFNGTSIDDLVKATGLLRGSLYKAFGSKRNLFELVLADTASHFEPTTENLDLLTVALKDVAPQDSRVSDLCRSIVGNDTARFAETLGGNLLAKMKEK